MPRVAPHQPVWESSDTLRAIFESLIPWVARASWVCLWPRLPPSRTIHLQSAVSTLASVARLASQIGHCLHDVPEGATTQ
eukprot:11665992-Alexandrium_andersonii.AAC.1